MMERTKRVRLKWILRMGFCLALVAAMVLIGAVLAGAEEPEYSEGLKFTSNGDGTCSVSGIGTCTDTEIVIPPVSPEGDAVTSIGALAFKDSSIITGITIPDGVTSIGNHAFADCYNMTSITIPKSVTSIGAVAFWGCDGLTDITLPDGVISIGNHAFAVCYNMTSITIPKSVKNIGDSAFMRCGRLTSITLSEGLTSIGEYAFENCDSLTNVTIPDSVASIGAYAFSGCTGLTSISIPEGNIRIGNGAFYDCTGLTSITIPEGVTHIGYKAFSGCTSLTNVNIPESVVSIGANAFFKCNVLTNITIPTSVTDIGEYAFAHTGLTSITIPEGVTRIDDYTFYDCQHLTSVTIPKSVVYIYDAAFSCCGSLTSITIPEGVSHIGKEAFYYCVDLTTINIPDGVTYIGDYAFACTGLTGITIPNGKNFNGSSVFYGCMGLTDITIPESWTNINFGTFSTCSNLTSITIPESVTQISGRAFYRCGSLTDVYYQGTEEQWNLISISFDNGWLLNATIHFLGETAESKLTSASLTLGQSLALNYYATLNPAHTAAVMRFTYHGETITVDGILDETTGEYKFTLGRIPPQCMGDNVKAELILISEDGTETVLDVKESYSIREYCDDALAANPNNEALATLLADLLLYGDASRKYTNYKEGTPVSDGFPVAPSEWEDVTDTDFTLSDKIRDDIRFTAAGVRFAYVNRLYFKLKAADLTGVTLTVNGKTYTAEDLALVEDTADTYIFYTDPVYATEFDKVFTAELSVDGEVIQTLTYSVKSYVYAKQNGENAEMAALARALYAYGRSAIAYKQEQ